MLLVVGATGHLGGAIARMLRAQGKAVRALVRPGADHEPLVGAGVALVPGDLKDRATLDRACAGVEAVVTTANAAQRGGADTPQSVDLEGNRNLIDAAKAAGVPQIVFVSTIVADAASPIPLLAAKGRTEAYLRDSGVGYTILAANAFMDFWVAVYIGVPAHQGATVTLVGEGRRRHSLIAASDVAQFAIASLGNPEAMDRRLVLGGPASVTFRDVVAAYERALRREVPVQSVRAGDPIPGLPQAVWGLAAALDTFDSPIEMTETARAFGVHLTTLDAFVRRTVDEGRA